MPRHVSQQPRTTRRPTWILALLLTAPLLLGSLQALAQDGPGAEDDLPGLLVYTRQSDDDVYWDLFTALGGGGSESQITDTEDQNSRGEDQPRWSPDGSQIAFTTFNKDGDEATIWRMPFDGGEPTLVAEADAPDAGYPAWRPDGAAIAYAGPHQGAGPSTLDLWLATESGSEVLIESADVDERSPEWSPDGDRIVYAAYDLGEAGQSQWWDLYEANADGSDPRPLVQRVNSSERYPRFSPDGSQLVYVTFGSPIGFGRGTLWLRDLESGQERELLRNVGLPAAWSPDGQWILVYNTVIAGFEFPGEPTPEPPEPSEPQRFGLYALRISDGTLVRLDGAAGGAAARANSFKWGQVADWTGGTHTPTPEFTDTPTPSATPTVTDTPTATGTAEASPTATRTPTRTASSTPSPPPGIYLPLLLRDVPLPATTPTGTPSD